MGTKQDASISQSISPGALTEALRSDRPPLVIDVRSEERFRQAPDWMRGALRRDPELVA
jgi:hypothetical protein